MYHQLAVLALTCGSLLASVIEAKPVAAVAPDRAMLPHYRPVPRHDGPRQYSHFPTKRSMVKRDANTTFDMGFEAKDVALFDGSWQALGQTFSLSLACVECRTWGTLVASAEFPEDLGDLINDLSDLNPLNDASLSVGFQGVGALVDLKLTTGGEGQFALPLFITETPLGISGPGFQVGIVFAVDLVLGITGEVSTEGGFQVAIPSESSFTIPLDPTVDNIAKFDGAAASLLPLSASAPANVTLALRLRVQAGLELPSSPLLEAKALAGAYLNIPEIILGEQFSNPPANGSNCILPASAEININAGLFVDIGADIGDIQLADFNPTLSTTLFSAAATTCFVTAGQATSTAAITTGTGGSGSATTAACPVPLTTQTASTTKTFTMTSCAAPVANCPASLTQVIVVAEPTLATTSGCPITLNATLTSSFAASASAAPYPIANATMPSLNGTGTAAAGGMIPLTSLTAPITSTLTIDPSVVAPDVPSITGSAIGAGGAVVAPTTTTMANAKAEATATGVETVYVTVTPTTCSISATTA